MPFSFNDIRRKLHLTAGVITALLAIGGGVGALAAYSDYLPATRGYAKDIAKLETDSALRVATARIGNLQRESAETRLQINQVRRDILRNDKSNRELQLKTTREGSIKRLLQQRIEEIDDALRDVNAERDRLKAFSTP
jgi:chromosome segregation ATPase